MLMVETLLVLNQIGAAVEFVHCGFLMERFISDRLFGDFCGVVKLCEIDEF